MILDKLAAATRKRMEIRKKEISLEQVREGALRLSEQEKSFSFPFEKAIAKTDISFICEVKKASPSKGSIVDDFPYLEIAKDYENAGADCISVLTEPDYFEGNDKYLQEISEEVRIPTLRKDFIIDEYMIYEAKLLHASCVLLIAALLDTETIRKYIDICDSLGLSALVEAHDEEEVRSAIKAGARMIGVNNRNLMDFTVDINNSRRLRELVPKDILFVAESGISTAKDIQLLREAGVNGVLIGETLMRSPDKAKMLQTLRGEACHMTKIKICGLKSLRDITIVNQYLPEYVGFVFANTKRFVTDEQARKMKQALDKRIQAVGVFVKEPMEHIVSLYRQGIIDVVQLHGDEGEEYITELKRQIDAPVMKALRVQNAEQVRRQLQTNADFILFDTYKKGVYGGSGERFSLAILKEGLKEKRKVKPFFLAGGLSPNNVKEVLGDTECYCVDVSTGVETNGKKDEEKIREFIEQVRGEKNK